MLPYTRSKFAVFINDITFSNFFILVPITLSSVACVASVSARVRRERWDESKKKMNEGGWGGERRKRLLRRLFHRIIKRNFPNAKQPLFEAFAYIRQKEICFK